jgi:hypothetical protein
MFGVRRLTLGVHLMATLLVPGSVRAADSTLAWTAPPTCPGWSVLRACSDVTPVDTSNVR